MKLFNLVNLGKNDFILTKLLGKYQLILFANVAHELVKLRRLSAGLAGKQKKRVYEKLPTGL